MTTGRGKKHDDKTDWRRTAEYAEGVTAFHKGLTDDCCPYRIGDQRRTGWFTGYYDERTRARVGRVLERNGLAWP